MGQRVKIPTCVIAALFFFGIVLRVHALGDKSFWGDEGDTVLAVDGIKHEGIPRFPSGAVYYKSLLISYLSAMFSIPFGVDEWSVRLPHALLGALMIPLAYIFGRTLFGEAVGIGSAAIITLSPWEIELSRNARYYSAFQVLYILGLFFLYKGFVLKNKGYKTAGLLVLILSSGRLSMEFAKIATFISLPSI